MFDPQDPTARQANTARQLRRIPEPQLEIPSFPVDQPKSVPTQPLVATQFMQVVQTTNPNACDKRNRPRRSSIVLTVPLSNGPRSRRASVASVGSVPLSISDADVPVLEVPIVRAGSPDHRRSHSPRMAFPVSPEPGVKSKPKPVVVTQVNQGIPLGASHVVPTTRMPTTVQVVASHCGGVPAHQLISGRPPVGSSPAVSLALSGAPQTTNVTTNDKSIEDHEDHENEDKQELRLELDGINVPRQEVQLQPWLSKMRRQWRERRHGQGRAQCHGKSSAPDESHASGAPTHPYVGVARQLGLINRTRRTHDWCGGTSRVHGNLWASRKCAKVPDDDDDALLRQLQQLPEW